MATLKPVEIIIDFETVYGEDPSPTKPYIIPMTDAGLTASQAMEQVNTIAAGRDSSRPYFGLIDVNGDLNIPVSYENFPLIMRMIFGEETSTALTERADSTDYKAGETVEFTVGTGSYICTIGGTSDSSEPTDGVATGDIITDGTVTWIYTTETLYSHTVATAPDCVGSFMCEIKFLEDCGAGSTDRYFKYNGLKGNTGTFNITTTGVLAFSVSTIGSLQTDSITTAGYTAYERTNEVTVPTNRLFQQDASVTIDDVKYNLVKGTTQSFNNNLVKDDLLGGTAAVTEGQFIVTGNLESIFDGDMFTAAKNHVKTAMDISFGNQFGGLIQNFPEVDFAYTTPTAAANASSPLSLDFTAYKDTGSTTYSYSCYNTIASY